MEYSNPKIPEEINYSKENPLKEFFILTLGISGVLVGLVLTVYLLAQSFAHYIPFKYEGNIAPAFSYDEYFIDESSTEQQTYINDLGQSLAKKMGLPKEMVLRIYYSDSDVVNAFASLNGLIVINQGLLDFVESENELAFILAHEIAHVKERHPIKSLGSGLIVSLAMSIIMGGDNSGAASTLTSGAWLTSLSFSRAHESESDVLALKAVQQYYGHATGSVGFFSRLKEEQYLPDMLTFISTHPGHNERIADIKILASELGFPLSMEENITPLPDFIQSVDKPL
jgi:Zn-dependent protease with chaperone function